MNQSNVENTHKDQGYPQSRQNHAGLSRQNRGTFPLKIRALRPILQRLGEMRRLDLLTPRQIGDCPRQFEYPVIGSRRKIQLAHGCADEIIPSFIQFIELPHLGHAHIGVADDVCPDETLQLALAGGLHPRADGFRRFSQPVAGEFFVVDTRHFNVNIDPVEHRAGDAFLVLGDG